MALSPSSVLVVDAGDFLGYTGVFPVLLASARGPGGQPGGQPEWQVVSLPALPGEGAGVGGYTPNLLVLPDGAIADVPQASWALLLPGATRWCQVTDVPAGAGNDELPTSFTTIGPALWWLDVLGSSVAAHHVDAASLGCR